MPHLIGAYKGDEMEKKAAEQPPFGPGFNSEEIAEADKLLVEGSSFIDPGDDYTRFTLMRGLTKVAERKLGGY